VTTDVRDALQNAKEIEITVTGRRSGRKFSTPVWFVQEGERLYLVPVTGTDSDWYKNVRKTPVIEVATPQQGVEASATPITDAARVASIVEKFRDKYGAAQVEAYYPKPNVAVEVPLG
jgi:deazaflavin-dependent oxidoreductase (nitroreductase family)